MKKWSQDELISLKELYVDEGIPLQIISRNLNRSVDSIRNKLYQLRIQEQIDKYIEKKEEFLDGAVYGYLDIETSDFSSDIGYMLSWCLKIKGKKVISDHIKRSEIFNETFDKRITKSLIEALKDIDIIVTFYGTGFDNKFIRSRALYWGFDFFKPGEKQHIDLYYKAKTLLKLHRGSLDSVTRFFGIDGKSHVDLKIWGSAKVGNPDAIKQVVEHNEQDVIILEKLHEKLEPYIKWTKKSL